MQTRLRGFAIAGSTGAGFTPSNTIERFTRATEASAAIAATTSITMSHGGCSVNSKPKSYTMGGDNSSGVSVTTIETLTFAAEASAVLGSALPTKMGAHYGSGLNNFDTGWQMGGGVDGGVSSSTAIVRLPFATETAATSSTVISTGTYFSAGVSSPAGKGFSMGGRNTAGTTFTRIDKFVFSGETISTLAATLDNALVASAKVNSPLKGYKMGGATASNVIEDMDFTAETSVVIAATLDAINQSNSGISFPDRGYALGGLSGGSANSAIIENLVYSGETSAAIATVLSVSRVDHACVHTPGML